MDVEELYGFRESLQFTRHLLELLDDDSYSRLQWYLLRRPSAGEVIRGGGGLRKLRWAASGRGKRGGAQVIYYLATAMGEIFLLDIYAKNQKADLSRKELKELQEIVRGWLDG